MSLSEHQLPDRCFTALASHSKAPTDYMLQVIAVTLAGNEADKVVTRDGHLLPGSSGSFSSLTNELAAERPEHFKGCQKPPGPKRRPLKRGFFL